MGCIPSVEKATPEPIPNEDAIRNTPAQIIAKEPVLTDYKLDLTTSLKLEMKQTATHGNGNTFEIGNSVSQYEDDWILLPAFGFGGRQLRRQMQDLLVLKRNKRDDPKETPLCYCIKSVGQGNNFYKILKDKPIHDSQPATIFEGPNNIKLYIYAGIEFDKRTLIGSVKLGGQGKSSPPLYTIRQCSKTVWVVKKSEVPIIQCTQVKGSMPKFSAWELVASPGVDPALVIGLTISIDWFCKVCSMENIKYYQ